MTPLTQTRLAIGIALFNALYFAGQLVRIVL
jgi:hypothetical protein